MGFVRFGVTREGKLHPDVVAEIRHVGDIGHLELYHLVKPEFVGGEHKFGLFAPEFSFGEPFQNGLAVADVGECTVRVFKEFFK